MTHHDTEVTMSRHTNEHATRTPSAATVDLKLEVVAIPVSDIDRAKAFYGGWGGLSTPISWSGRTFERCS